jgi:hypothetical protein
MQMDNLHHWIKHVPWAVVVVCAMCAINGCRTNKPAAAPTTRPVELLQKPAIDLSRSGAGFPIHLNTPPADAAALIDGLQRAYASRLEDNPNIRITTQGEQFTALQSIEIDLTGSTVRGDYTPKPPLQNTALTPFINTRILRYIAAPLRYQTYAASMMLEAQDAELSLSPAQDNQQLLSLTDCSRGSVRLTIGRHDLEAGLTAGARLRRSIALSLESVKLSLQSESDRSLQADLLVRSRVVLVPATFRLTGRVDVDDQFNVHFKNLSARGRDPSGAVLAGVIQARLDKLNNKAAPLLRLPGDKIRVTGLNITLDDALSIHMQFQGTR